MDDAARQIWKGTWRIPTKEELTALLDDTKFTWAWQNDYNGAKGMLVTSKVTNYTGNSIFLPAAGQRTDYNLEDTGAKGSYWSSSLFGKQSSKYAQFIFIRNDGYKTAGNFPGRYCGYSLRAVAE